jgi:hypothetical protein
MYERVYREGMSERLLTKWVELLIEGTKSELKSTEIHDTTTMIVRQRC